MKLSHAIIEYFCAIKLSDEKLTYSWAIMLDDAMLKIRLKSFTQLVLNDQLCTFWIQSAS
jgi:hypothetical protein